MRRLLLTTTLVLSCTSAFALPTSVETPRGSSSKSVTDKLVGSFQTLVDTIQETDALRKKIERSGYAET
jgi:hypothetical protein